jgi:hypothetical protein
MYAATLALTFVWPILFFRLYRLDWAFAELILLIVAEVSTFLAFCKVSGKNQEGRNPLIVAKVGRRETEYCAVLLTSFSSGRGGGGGGTQFTPYAGTAVADCCEIIAKCW